MMFFGQVSKLSHFSYDFFYILTMFCINDPFNYNQNKKKHTKKVLS